jgi:benzoate membrane transport protein
MCLLCGFGSIVLSTRYRIPVTLAWSTPGAALLATAPGGWQAAVGSFIVAGLLIALTGTSRRLGQLIRSIPAPLAQAMLAGILLPLCIGPVVDLKSTPWAIGPVLVVWIVLQHVAPKWAVSGCFAVAIMILVGYLVAQDFHFDAASLAPTIELSAPHWSWSSIVGVALPLFVVTMASQNIPGLAVMKSFGYDVPWRPSMLFTGLSSAATATAGTHAINLAAIGASFSAAPAAHPDPSRRWIAGVSTGCTFVVLGLFAPALSAFAEAGPEGLIEAVAGIALLGVLTASLAGALSDVSARASVGVTLVVSASGVAFFSIGSAFWGLAAGLVVHALKARLDSPSEASKT